MEWFVSIPNGDRHYLELRDRGFAGSRGSVSIPNGDRHYLEHFTSRILHHFELFQSPMGIGITSNSLLDHHRFQSGWVSIPNGDRHYLERSTFHAFNKRKTVSIPNGDRHYLERRSKEGVKTCLRTFQSPMGIGITSNSRSPS